METFSVRMILHRRVVKSRSPILVIAGATASGKTALAVDLALRMGGELVGADSVQVYERLVIGSARPTETELRGVPHHLLGVVPLSEPFDASRYVALADAAIEGIVARGHIPIVVGGTGLYLRALVRGLAQGIPSDPELRQRLNARAAEGPSALATMHQELARVDPSYAAMIHVNDPIRIVRALEVFTTTGVAYSEHHRRHAAEGPRYRAHFVALDVTRAALASRIAARTHTMLERGLIHEVRTLLDEGYSPDLKPLRSVGYAEVVAHCLGRVERSVLEEAIAKSTRDYAKRQRTWFRGEQGVTWMVPDAHTLDKIVAATEVLFAGE